MSAKGREMPPRTGYQRSSPCVLVAGAFCCGRRGKMVSNRPVERRASGRRGRHIDHSEFL